MIMRNILYRLILVCSVFCAVLVGCVKVDYHNCPTNESQNVDVKQLSNGCLGVSADVNLAQRDVVDTRLAVDPNAQESKIDNVWVIVFDEATGKKIQLLKGAYDAARNKMYAEFTPYASKVKLRYMLNISLALQASLESVSDISGFLDLTLSNDVLSSTSYPMSSDWVVVPSVSVSSMKGLVVNVGFCYARIDIKPSSTIAGDGIASGFQILGALVMNAPASGYLLSHSSLPVNLGGVVSTTTEKIASSNAVAGLYMFENSGAKSGEAQGSNPTDVIIRGQKAGYPQGYYKIRLRYDKSGIMTYDVNRNVLYSITLSDVRGAGYATLQEAIDNAQANIEYSISVVDPNSTDYIANNGEYYMSFTNSECDVYADGALEGVVVSRFKYDKGTGVNFVDWSKITKSVTAYGAGLSVATPVFAAGSDIDIRVAMTADFVSGNLIVRIGNIMKTITITRKSAITSSETVISNYQGFVSAHLYNSSVASWLMLGTTSADCASVPFINSSATGNIFVKFAKNTALAAGVRMADVFMTHSGNRGRVRVLFYQNPPMTSAPRITWDPGNRMYALTTDATDAGLFFKFGSVIGVYSGNAGTNRVLTNKATTYPDYSFNAATDITYNFSTVSISGTGSTGWNTVPYLLALDVATNHTVANVKAGKGDPCRLVGKDLTKIKTTAVNLLTVDDIDNKKWRLPNNEDNKAFSGYNNDVATTSHWWSAGAVGSVSGGVPGGEFPVIGGGNSSKFLPAAGGRTLEGTTIQAGLSGYYWSSDMYNTQSGYNLRFSDIHIYPISYLGRYVAAYPVRCVPQNLK